VCQQRIARQKGSPKPQSTNECDTAGAGYSDRRDHQQRHQEASAVPRYNKAGYEPAYQPADELATFKNVKRQQMDYLHGLLARAGQGGAVEHITKCGGRRDINEVEFQLSNLSIDVVGSPCTVEQTAFDIWFEPIVINHRKAYVKTDTGAKVNVMSRRHFLEFSRILRESRVVLVSFSQQIVQPIRNFTEVVKINGRHIPMQFQVVPSCTNVLISYQDPRRAALIPEMGHEARFACGV
jgi:hypothetical protein